MMRQKECTCIHCFVLHCDAIISEIALRCTEMLCLFSCFHACEENAVYTQGVFPSPFSHATSTRERANAPCQPKL